MARSRACGAAGLTVEDPEECGAVVVVEAVVDPFEPPMPPKVSLDQAAKMAKALARGEPNRGRIALTIASDRVRELI
jgi:pyruvate dehydrogenase (quinone)/pyruvate oxidase